MKALLAVFTRIHPYLPVFYQMYTPSLPVFTRIYPCFSLRDPGNVCVLLPLGSPWTGPKQPYVHVPVVPWLAVAVHDPWMCVLGGYLGGVYRVGNTGGYMGGLYRVLPTDRAEPVQPPTSGAGPGSPARAGVGG